MRLGRAFFPMSVLAGLGSSCVSPSPSPIRLNEVMAANSDNCRDQAGEHDDWIELYNPSDEAVDLGGYSLTDDTVLPRQSVLVDGLVIQPGSTLLFWADGTPAQGQTHLTFSLKADGEEVVLYDSQTRQVDLFRWSAAQPNLSLARVPDGSGAWVPCRNPTCGAVNTFACGTQ